jgi:hypothetical protein
MFSQPVPADQTLQRLYVLDLVEPAVRKGFWGSPYIPFPAFMAIKFRSFEIGGVIGASLKSKLRVLARMLGPGAGFHKVAEDLLARADTKLSEFRSLMSGQDPDSLLELFTVGELRAKGAPGNALHAWANKKVEVGMALGGCDVALVQGIGFGARFPELTARLWKATWERDKEAFAEEMKATGLPLQSPTSKVTFEVRAEQIVESVQVIAAARFGDLSGYLGTPVAEVSSVHQLVDGSGTQRKVRITLHDVQGWAWDTLNDLLCPSCVEKKLEDDFQFWQAEWRRRIYSDYIASNPSAAESVKRLVGPAWVGAHDEIMAMALAQAEALGNEEEAAMLDELEYLAPLSRNLELDLHTLLVHKPLPMPENPWRCNVCHRALATTWEDLTEPQLVRPDLPDPEDPNVIKYLEVARSDGPDALVEVYGEPFGQELDLLLEAEASGELPVGFVERVQKAVQAKRHTIRQHEGLDTEGIMSDASNDESGPVAKALLEALKQSQEADQEDGNQ